MKPPKFDYHAPASVDEALALLTRYGGDAKILAGGQSLMPLDLLFRSSVSLALVIGLLWVFVWAVRRGGLRRKNHLPSIAIETATAIGERRSLVIVAVEGRRLLLGLTPGTISMLTDLGPAPSPLEDAVR